LGAARLKANIIRHTIRNSTGLFPAQISNTLNQIGKNFKIELAVTVTVLRNFQSIMILSNVVIGTAARFVFIDGDRVPVQYTFFRQLFDLLNTNITE
jgi:hypothetical protein